MATSLGIVNDRLDEVLKRELRNYRPKSILVKVVSLDGLLPESYEKYLVFTEVKGVKSRRIFASVYQGDNPKGFLEVQGIRLDEMFACNIETYIEGELYDGQA